MNVLVNEASLTAIANSIRAKGVTGTFKPSQMASAIDSISTGSKYLVVRGCLYESEDIATVSGTKIISESCHRSGTKIIFD